MPALRHWVGRTASHYARVGVEVPSEVLAFVRFLSFLSLPPPPPAPFFFFAFVTLIGSGVPGRGTSPSRSYAGKREGRGAAAVAAPSGVADLLPFPIPYARCDGVGEADAEPTGRGN